MNDQRIVVSGLGVIASNGIGKEAFFEATFKGASGIKPISLFDTAPFAVKSAGEATDFKPQQFLGDKGLRTLDRSTRLISSAAKLALTDAGLEITEENSCDIGVVAGTTLGSLASISDFDKEGLKEGVRYVNPALFPNTVLNSPASQVSIRFKIKGLNVTLSSGFCASLDALNYAQYALKSGRIKAVLAGGVEELCLQTFLGFLKAGCLAGLNNKPELSCPFDQRRNGVILGEGACLLILEELEAAKKRNAHFYAEIKGFGSAFGNLKKSMQLALEEAKIAAKNIDFIASGANSTQELDLTEAKAIKEVFGAHAKKVQVSAVKSMIGECYSAAGSLQTAVAIAALEKQALFPTMNYRERDPECDLNLVLNEARSCKIENILVNNFGPHGEASSLVVSRFGG